MSHEELTEVVEQYLIDNGPTHAESITEGLYEDGIAHLEIHGIPYMIPATYIDDVIVSSDMFTLDDSGRVHLTNGVR